MKSSSKRPEKGMSDHPGILERPLEKELTERALMMYLIFDSLYQLGDIETQISVIQEWKLGHGKHSDPLIAKLGV